MTRRTLSSAPSMLPLYARAAASMIPGASLLPFVPGRGREIPDVDLTLADVRVDPNKVATYAKVCGFALREQVPPTYPHVLAFPLHMAAMADGRFPFGAVGLVHIENRIVQHRPIALGEELEIRVRASKLEPHPRGRTFALLSDVVVDGERVWEGISTMLRRGGGGPAETGPSGDSKRAGGGAATEGDSAASSPESSVGSTGLSSAPYIEWRLGGDLGRRYAAVSGDRNPIHMHALAAKPLGFPRAIVHGMWTKAHSLAALESRLPEAFSVEVRFRKPILLPARVQFASAAQGEQIDFAVKDAKRHTTHLEGRMRPLNDGRNPK